MILEIITFLINKIITSYVEGYILLTLLLTLGMKKRFSFKYFNVLMISQIIIIYEVVFAVTYPNKNIIQLFISSILILLVVQLNFKGNIFKKIISFGLFITILLISEAVLFICMSLIGINPTIIYTKDIYYSFAAIIAIIIKLIILNLIVSKIFKTKISFGNRYQLQVILLIFFAIIACYSIVEAHLISSIDKSNINVFATIIMFASVIIIPILVLFISTKIIKQTKKQAEQQQLLEQYELEHKYSKELNIVLGNLRILKHDLKNHISCMWGLVETNSIHDFKLYLAKLTNELEELNEDELVSELINVKVIGDD